MLEGSRHLEVESFKFEGCARVVVKGVESQARSHVLEVPISSVTHQQSYGSHVSHRGETPSSVTRVPP